MNPSKEFTPWDFLNLVKELNEHEADLRIKMAKAGVANSNDLGPEGQTSSTSRP